MDRLICCVALALLAVTEISHAAAFEPVFSIEDGALRPLPPKALAAVRAGAKKTLDADCLSGRFVGAAVDLAGHGRPKDWIAMTETGCGWGASSAHIWVLRWDGSRYRVVLSTGGHDMGVGRRKTNGLLDLKTTHGTAGYYSETQYRFDGRRYRESVSRYVNLADPAGCRKNRDLEVCKPGN